jgi:putative transcriptional regulator
MKNRLRELRARHDMTQEELAKKTGVTRQTIIALEAERYSPSLELAFRLAKVLGAPVDMVFTPEK